MNIAVLAGARVQKALAMESAGVIAQCMGQRGHQVWIVTIDESGWYTEGSGRRLLVDNHELTFIGEAGLVRFDFVFIALHDQIGKGPIQGFLDLQGIPYDSSGQLASLSSDNKSVTKILLAPCNVRLAKGLIYQAQAPISHAAILAHVGLPCFVKPNRGGSAIGCTRITEASQLDAALSNALQWDSSILVEAFIPGREVTCGVVRLNGQITTLPLTEYLLDGGCKTWEGNQGTVPKQTPAALPPAIAREIHESASLIYRELDCRGLTRIDYRLHERENLAPYFLEINTLPGLEWRGAMITQIIAAGLDVGEVFQTIMDDALARNTKENVGTQPLPVSTVESSGR